MQTGANRHGALDRSRFPRETSIPMPSLGILVPHSWRIQTDGPKVHNSEILNPDSDSFVPKTPRNPERCPSYHRVLSHSSIQPVGSGCERGLRKLPNSTHVGAIVTSTRCARPA